MNTKIILMLAWRNLWRNKRRSLVVISSIAFGIFAMIISMSLMNGFNNQMVENTISTSLGHAAIHKKGFQDSMKLELNFTANAKTLKALESDPWIKAWAPRVKAQGMLRSSEASRGVMLVGVDPEREKRLTKVSDYLVNDNESRYLLNAADKGILISKALAKRLDLFVGDRLVLMMQDSKNEIVGVGMQVVGIFQTPVESFDKFVAFTGIKTLQEIAGLGGAISEINLILHERSGVDAVKRALIASIGDPGLEVLSWKDMAPNLVSAIQLFDTMMYIFFAIVFITVIFSITNTLIMAIMERFHEIGVMKSLGTKPSMIFWIIMSEAANLGLVGLTAGTVLGVGLTALLGVKGIDFAVFNESMRLWGTGSVIYPAIKAMDIVAAGGIVLATTAIAALYPALKAARIRPLEALHFV
jgi:ABC-type lipoprotein release transport system permease subunit